MNRQTRIAIAAEFRKLAEQVEKAEKALFLDFNDPGTRIPVTSDVVDADGKKVRIGYVIISDPKPAQASAEIVDEQEAIVWALREFNDSMLAEQKLTEQGRKTVIAAAEAAFAAGKPLPSGVQMKEVAARRPSVSWYGEDNARELLEDMQARGVFSLAEALGLKALEPTVIDAEGL